MGPPLWIAFARLACGDGQLVRAAGLGGRQRIRLAQGALERFVTTLTCLS